MSVERRRFLKGLLVSGAAAALGGGRPEARAATQEAAQEASKDASKDGAPRVRAYRPLGRTGFKMSDISMGGADESVGPEAYLAALQLGINYFDTAPDYGNGDNERTIGAALRRWKGRREDIWITTKMCAPSTLLGHLPPTATKAEYLEALQGSLERLGVSYVDGWFLHAVGGTPFRQAERLESEGMWAAVAEAKERGWVRHVGLSSHGPFKKLEYLTRAVDSGRFDLMLAAYGFLGGKGGTRVDEMKELFRKARAKGMGVVAMKTVPRASAAERERLRLELKSSAPYETLCFKWVLSNPDVSGLIKSVRSAQDLAGFLRASGGELTEAETEDLTRYAEALDGETCRIGCGDCLDACPAGVEIPTILRYGSYFEDYGRERAAMEKFARLGARAPLDACRGCPAPCASACTYGLDVPRLLERAGARLAWPARGGRNDPFA